MSSCTSVGDEAVDGRSTQLITTTSAAIWETYDSIESLAQAAVMVAVVEVESETRRYAVLEDDGTEVFIRVVHTATVAEVLLGDQALASRSIEITYIDFGSPSEHVTPYRQGERLLMFLAPTGPTAAGTWAPLSSNEGVFEFTSSGGLRSRALGPLRDRETTLEDLRSVVRESSAG